MTKNKRTFISNLFRHKHKWHITAVNRFHIATEQRCGCGMIREVETEGCKPLMFKWIYSDGTESEQYDFGDLSEK